MRRYLALIATAFLGLGQAQTMSAQVGYLTARAHLAGEQPASRMPIHTYFASGDSLVDRPDGVFPPGQYTIKRLEVGVKACVAVASNVPFTIVAGQLTEIDPLVTLQSCRMRAAPASDYGGVGRVELIPQASSQASISCDLANSGVVLLDSPSDCALTLPYGEAFDLRLTPLDINSEVRDVQYQSACVSENQTKVYNCAYVGDTLSSWIVGAERFISSTSNAIPYADGSITLIGTTQSGLGTISHFRVSNAGPSIYYGEVDTRVDPASPNYGFVAPSFADGPCQVGCVFRLGAGYSMDFDVRTVPYFYRSTDGSLVIPQGNRYCSFVEIRALDVGAGLHTTSADADTSNNHAPCFSGDVQVTVTPGTSSPRNQTVASGSANVPMLQFALNPPSPTTLDNITLTASGTGNEQVDVTAVRLYVDGNSNGTVDAGDTAIASGTFGANDGTVRLAVTPPYGVSGPTSFLVTYDFNVTIASRFGGAIMLAGLLPLILVPRKRRRGIVGLLLLVGAFGITGLGLGACGGDSTSPNPNPGGSATYTVQLTGATAGGSAISGVSVQGATVTIAK